MTPRQELIKRIRDQQKIGVYTRYEGRVEYLTQAPPWGSDIPIVSIYDPSDTSPEMQDYHFYIQKHKCYVPSTLDLFSFDAIFFEKHVIFSQVKYNKYSFREKILRYARKWLIGDVFCDPNKGLNFVHATFRDIMGRPPEKRELKAAFRLIQGGAHTRLLD